MRQFLYVERNFRCCQNLHGFHNFHIIELGYISYRTFRSQGRTCNVGNSWIQHCLQNFGNAVAEFLIMLPWLCRIAWNAETFIHWIVFWKLWSGPLIKLKFYDGETSALEKSFQLICSITHLKFCETVPVSVNIGTHIYWKYLYVNV